MAVIRRWADTLRGGDEEGAAKTFALPAIVSNGTPPLRLRTREEVVVFNQSLPCGAKIKESRAGGGYVSVVFTLTDRPGGDCGSGTGALASTAFKIRDGKIVEWRRLQDTPQAPQFEGEEV